MPFYEYECPSCKYYTEVMQKITDAPLAKCPSCGKSGLKKLVSAPVFRLKGGGWYETDFKSDKENKRNLHGGDKDESKPEGKEAKPEAKETKEVKETKPTEAKASSDTGAGATARTRTTAAAKPAKPTRPAARRPARRSSARSARKHRR